MKLGDSASVTRQFSASQLASYAQLARLTQEPAYVPEPLVAALFSYLLGVELPGPGTNYLKQDLNFISHPPIGETVTARVEITRIRSRKKLVDLATAAYDSKGVLFCEGRALVFVGDITCS